MPGDGVKSAVRGMSGERVKFSSDLANDVKKSATPLFQFFLI